MNKMPEKMVWTVEEEHVGGRADAYVQQMLIETFPEQEATWSRSYVQKIIADDGLAINGKIASKSAKVALADQVELTIPPLQELDVVAEDIPLDVFYEDEDLLVVNKPRGMVVHPGAGNWEHTLVNALLFHCKDHLSGVNGVLRPGIVHRIDKDTSGLLVVAKNDMAHVRLSEQLSDHSMQRMYHGIVHGVLEQPQGTIDAPIGRKPNDRIRFAVTPVNSKEAVTHYRVMEFFEKYTYATFRLETGRTHQIRVHMASIGHPLVGDPLYGPQVKNPLLSGQCLHAGLLGFIHPRTEQYMEFQAPLPQYFTDLLRRLEQNG